MYLLLLLLFFFNVYLSLYYFCAFDAIIKTIFLQLFYHHTQNNAFLCILYILFKKQTNNVLFSF